MPSFASDRVDDTVAHLSFLCPADWQRREDELISPFTSTVTNGSGAMVSAGRWEHLLAEPPSAAELIAGAAWLASEYGEFFLPLQGNRTEVVMEDTTVAGLPAARAGYLLLFHSGDGEPTYVRVLVVALAADLISFLLAVAPDTERHIVDGILASTQPLPLAS